MPRFKPKGILERSAIADLWKHTLSRIPTVYGRLCYLASLRDSATGSYRHHGLAVTFGREESTRAMRQSHEEWFAQWTAKPLAEKNADLISYLAGLGEPVLDVVTHWRRSGHYRTLAPDSATRAERELFTLELETLLSVLHNEEAANAPGAGPGVPSSRRPG